MWVSPWLLNFLATLTSRPLKVGTILQVSRQTPTLPTVFLSLEPRAKGHGHRWRPMCLNWAPGQDLPLPPPEHWRFCWRLRCRVNRVTPLLKAHRWLAKILRIQAQISNGAQCRLMPTSPPLLLQPLPLSLWAPAALSFDSSSVEPFPAWGLCTCCSLGLEYPFPYASLGEFLFGFWEGTFRFPPVN